MLLPIGTAHTPAGAARAGLPAVDAELVREIDARRPLVTEWPRDTATGQRLFGELAALWDCQGAELVDVVTGAPLLAYDGGLLLQRPAVGLAAVGATRSSTSAIELVGGAVGGVQTDGSGFGDLVAGECGIVLALRFGRAAAVPQLIAWSGAPTLGASPSWQLVRDGGQITLTVTDGSAVLTLFRTLPKTTDRAWHFVAIKSAGGTLSLWCDWSTLTSTSTAPLASESTGDSMKIGGHATQGAAAVQIALIALVTDVGALTTTATATWWRHGRRPEGLDDYARYGSVAIVVDRSADGGVLLGEYYGNQTAIGFDPRIRNGHHGGLWSGGGVALENTLIDGSLDRWSTSSATVTVGATDSPHGMRDGVTLTATATGGYASKAFTIAAAGAGVRLIARARAAASVTIEIWQSTGTALAASTTISLGAEYREIEWRPVPGFTGSASIRIKPGTGAAGASIDLDEVQWVPGIAAAAVGGYITNGSSAVECGVVAASSEVDTDLGDGELRAEGIAAAVGTYEAIASIGGAASVLAEVRAIVYGPDGWFVYATGPTGNPVDGGDGQITVPADQVHADVRFVWRSDKGLRMRLDPELLAGSAAEPQWRALLAVGGFASTGLDTCTLSLGREPELKQTWRGWISRVRVYRRIRGEFVYDTGTSSAAS